MLRHRSKDEPDDAPLAQSKDADATADRAADAATEPDDTLISRTVTINRPRAELYAFWREFGNLARFMENVERVAVRDATHSHWAVKGPGGTTVEWDAVITDDRPQERIAWSTTGDGGPRHAGSVEFRDAPGGRGTQVAATIVYDPPGGAIGKAVAKLLQREPKVQVRRDLRRFKQLMETGEIATATPPDAAPRA